MVVVVLVAATAVARVRIRLVAAPVVATAIAAAMAIVVAATAVAVALAAVMAIAAEVAAEVLADHADRWGLARVAPAVLVAPVAPVAAQPSDAKAALGRALPNVAGNRPPEFHFRQGQNEYHS